MSARRDGLIGTPLRDAAVDPQPGDYMAPVNASKPGAEGNPHGGHVVSLQAKSPTSGQTPQTAQPKENTP